MSEGGNIDIGVIFRVFIRFGLIYIGLSLFFLVIVRLCYQLFVKNYTVVDKYQDKKLEHPLKHGDRLISDTFVDSDEEEEASDFVSSFLDHSVFYKNLNNSSQYLRRDSFIQ